MNHEFWYLSRAAGFTAYMLLFVSVALGIGMGTRLFERIARRNVIFDLHRFTTLLALAFMLFHVYILLGDAYFNFNVWQLSVPFLSPYRSWQAALGVASLYLTLIIALSFYVRQFIGYRAWRALHFVTFALFGLALLHGITAGTDTHQLWARLIYLATGSVTLALIMYRVQYRMPNRSGARQLRLVGGALAAAFAIATLFGTGMLANANRQTSPQTAQLGASAADALPSTGAIRFVDAFQSDFSGSYRQTRGSATTQLVVDGTASGDLNVDLHVELVQAASIPTPDDEDSEQTADDEERESQPRVDVVVNKAQLRAPANGDVLCDGQLTALDDGAMRLSCNGSGPLSGVRVTLASQLRALEDGTLTGAVRGTMQRIS